MLQSAVQGASGFIASAASQKYDDPLERLGDPLRSFTPARAGSMLEDCLHGRFTDAQWLFELVQGLDGDIIALTERRVGAVKELPYSIKINESLAKKKGLEQLAATQKAALEERYERFQNLSDAIGALAASPFRKYAHVQIVGDRFEPVEQWWWLRDGLFGDWIYNPDLRMTSAKGAPEESKIDPREWLIRESRLSCFWVALIKYLRSSNNEKWWDRFCEQCSKNGTLIIGPAGIAEDKLLKFTQDALEIARSGNGVLPNGSDIKATGPQRQGAPPFQARLDSLREALILAGTGGLLTMITAPTGLGDGTSDQHADAFRILRNKDAAEISQELQRKIDKPLLDRAFPGLPALAYFELAPAEKPSPSSFLDDAVKAKQAGFQMDAAELSEKTGYKLTLSPSTPAQPSGFAFNRSSKKAPKILNASAARISSQPWLDSFAESAIQPLSKSRAGMFASLLQELKGVPTPEKALAILQTWAPAEKDARPFADSVVSLAFNSALRGHIPQRLKPSTLKNALRIANADSSPLSGLFGLPYEEAKAFWAKKGLSEDLINATWAQSQAYGFKVAGITSRNALNALKDSIGRIIDGKATIDDFVKSATDEYGLNPVHAEIVARTNVQTAYAWGNYQMLEATKEDFPIWGFDVVVDAHTSNVCAPLANLAYPADDPIWDTLYPPNHYNCRTTIAQFSSVEEAESAGFTVMNYWPRDPSKNDAPYMPQKGFEFNVGKVPNLEDAVA